jgi:hypothetical protein
MVSRSYLLDKPDLPLALKQYIHHAAIPAAIDALAYVESAARRVANAARRSPLSALALALSGGIALAAAIAHRRKRT